SRGRLFAGRAKPMRPGAAGNLSHRGAGEQESGEKQRRHTWGPPKQEGHGFYPYAIRCFFGATPANPAQTHLSGKLVINRLMVAKSLTRYRPQRHFVSEPTTPTVYGSCQQASRISPINASTSPSRAAVRMALS